jgi:NADPH:quinone reductase-like Zn-dependent oxidoreductase
VINVGPNGAFKAGQLVFGAFSRSVQGGTLAQYIIAPSSECALLPAGVSIDSAAAVGTAGMTAYRSLLPEYVKPGSKVFINGGSGGVGSWAIQIAKMKGSEVTTTCSTANVELCKSLGADTVLDYKKVDILSELNKIGPVFDLAVDNVGSIPGLYEHSHMFLKEKGAFAQVAMTLGPGAFGTVARRMMLPRMLGGGSRKFYFIHTKTTAKDLVQIGEWMATGRVRSIVDGVFEFEEAPKAFERLRAGRTRGKLIIHVGDEQRTEGI